MRHMIRYYLVGAGPREVEVEAESPEAAIKKIRDFYGRHKTKLVAMRHDPKPEKSTTA
jgi:hypothetical protein